MILNISLGRLDLALGKRLCNIRKPRHPILRTAPQTTAFSHRECSAFHVVQRFMSATAENDRFFISLKGESLNLIFWQKETVVFLSFSGLKPWELRNRVFSSIIFIVKNNDLYQIRAYWT